MKAVAKIETRKYRPAQRSLGRVIEIDTEHVTNHESQSVQDLIAETFWEYLGNPERKEEIPAGRELNDRLINWVKSGNGWDASKSQTNANLLASALAAPILTQYLMNNEEVKKAMDEQEKAEKAEKEAQEAEQKAQAEQNEQKKAELQAKAQAAKDKAQAHKDAAQAQMDKLENSPSGQGVRALALKKAKEETKETLEEMTGWGMEPGEVTPQNLEETKRILKDHDLGIIAKMIGRIKGISMAHKSKKKKQTMTVTEAGYSRDVTKLFPSEVAMLRPDAPKIFRALKMAEYCDHGLLGMVSVESEKEEGRFVFMMDDSGSMGSHFDNTSGKDDVARALGIGIAKASQENGQKFTLCSFDDDVNPWEITDESTSKEIIEWAGMKSGGGTDFDPPMSKAISIIEGDDDDNADILFCTDGQSALSKKIAADFRDLSARRGTRLILLKLGAGSPMRETNETTAIENLATTVIEVNETGDLEKLAEHIATALERD